MSDFVRIGDLRQILAQLLHTDHEAILQVKDVVRAMTVLEVVEDDMARVSRAMNNPPTDDEIQAECDLENFRQMKPREGDALAYAYYKRRWAAGMERQKALMVECEQWKRRIATGINLLRGWLQHHEGKNAVVPVNATRSYIGEPAPEGWMADPPEPTEQEDWKTLYDKGFAHTTKLGEELLSAKQAVVDLKADLAQADNALVDALILLSDWTADRRREDLERDTKLFLAKHTKPECK